MLPVTSPLTQVWEYEGGCHCGAVRVHMSTSRPAAELPLRACQCGFCRRHGAQTTSDPASTLHLIAAPGALRRYRFGRRKVDAVLCQDCGVYIASVLSDGDRLFATLNVAGVALEAFSSRSAEPAVYDDETDTEKLARRRARWIPTTLIEAMPSA